MWDKIKVKNDWVVVSPITEKNGLVIPTEGNVGTVVAAGDASDDWVKSLVGDSVHFGRDADRVPFDGKVIYVMSPSNIYFAIDV